MITYLQPANESVVKGLEEFEVVYAVNQQDKYNPLRTLRSKTEEGRVLSRWTLTDEQRKAIAEGADVFLELLTFGGDLQPIMLAVGTDPNPDYFREQYGLPVVDLK